jgi:hypothetical protein
LESGIPSARKRSISSDLRPVWSQTFITLTPRFTAVVTKPDRKLCPPNAPGSKPSLAAAALTTLATLRGKPLIRHALNPPIENAPKDSPLADADRLEPSLKRRHWACIWSMAPVVEAY